MLLAFLFGAADSPGVHGARQARTPDRGSCGMMFSCPQSSCSPRSADASVIRAGGIQERGGWRAILWRMCFGLFIASGSFVAQLPG